MGLPVIALALLDCSSGAWVVDTRRWSVAKVGLRATAALSSSMVASCGLWMNLGLLSEAGFGAQVAVAQSEPLN